MALHFNTESTFYAKYLYIEPVLPIDILLLEHPRIRKTTGIQTYGLRSHHPNQSSGCVWRI